MSDLQLGDTDPDNTGHTHRYGIHPHGDGNTDIINNHLHIIIQGKVLASGEDNHIHPDVPYPFKGTDRDF